MRQVTIVEAFRILSVSSDEDLFILSLEVGFPSVDLEPSY